MTQTGAGRGRGHSGKSVASITGEATLRFTLLVVFQIGGVERIQMQRATRVGSKMLRRESRDQPLFERRHRQERLGVGGVKVVFRLAESFCLEARDNQGQWDGQQNRRNWDGVDEERQKAVVSGGGIISRRGPRSFGAVIEQSRAETARVQGQTARASDD